MEEEFNKLYEKLVVKFNISNYQERPHRNGGSAALCSSYKRIAREGKI